MTTVEPVHDDMLRLEALHDLLPTLGRALDVRDIFTQLSAIAARVVPHDEANLAVLTPDKERFRLFASTNPSEPSLICAAEHCAVQDPAIPRVFDIRSWDDRAVRSGVRAPVRIGDELVGVIAFLSRSSSAFTERDLALVQRIADYVAIAMSHQRLAEDARRAAVERERAAHIAASEELLRTLSDALDIRAVFPRLSEITTKVLPHDRLTLSFHDHKGNVVVRAVSNDDGPTIDRVRLADPGKLMAEGAFKIIGDLAQEPLRIDEPADFGDQWLAFGYRSLLGVHVSARQQRLGLLFWSKEPYAFGPRDVPVARRIADHVALAVSHEQLADAARQVAEARARADRLELRVKSLSEELDAKSGYGRLIGKSDEWIAILKQATQVADTETTVLLTGESGTGKEVIARFIHRASARKTGPFVALNCAALPEQLLESELFGHERGAFTGAQQSKPGQIELAAGGVLFLDEVGEMSPVAQAKFLRVLQEREFQRLGSTRVLKANVRIIAATNRDLRKAMERGDFREDLFYRLQVFDIRIPPLRERSDDILPLSEAFLKEIGRSFGRPPAGMTRDAREALLAHPWPGNVRELRNALERAAIVCEGGLIAAEHLSLRRGDHPATSIGSVDLNVVEREMIERVLRECNGNKSRAATRLGITRTQLYVRLRKYEIRF
jgi:transcriptional regulator with GAF, ATPase, and Fis domain